MRIQESLDVTSVYIHLNELRSEFDRAIREGEPFSVVKKIYFEIKELECHVQALAWDPEREYR